MTAPSDPPSVLTVPEVAAALRCSRSNIYERIRVGEIRALRLGRTVRVSRRWLEDALATGTLDPLERDSTGIIGALPDHGVGDQDPAWSADPNVPVIISRAGVRIEIPRLLATSEVVRRFRETLHGVLGDS